MGPFGVRVHSHSEGTAIDFFVIDLNMELVSTSTHWCVRHLVSGGRLSKQWPSTARECGYKCNGCGLFTGCGLLIGVCDV